MRGVSPPVWAQTSPMPCSPPPRQAGVDAAPGIIDEVRAGPGHGRGHLARQVSTLIATSGWASLIAATSPATRRISSAASTSATGPGLHAADVDDVGPRRDGPAGRSSAAPNSCVAPRSKKESGVRLITAMTANEPGGHSR